jgi:hypothetical protein
MDKYRIDKQGLLDRISAWDGFLNKKVHLIACGGTALTLAGVKDSTKDIDLVVPNIGEYEYLIMTLEELGYKNVTGSGFRKDDSFIFDFFRGNKVHTTELLEPSLKKGNHILVKEFRYIYLGLLNYYDLIISKLFRATSIDIEDCLALVKAKKKEIDIEILKRRFIKTASFDVSEERVNKNLARFLGVLKKEGLYNGA